MGATAAIAMAVLLTAIAATTYIQTAYAGSSGFNSHFIIKESKGEAKGNSNFVEKTDGGEKSGVQCNDQRPPGDLQGCKFH